MAILKMIGAIHRPRNGKGGKYRILKNTIDYILNPKKTAGGLYTGSLNCMCASACEDMIETNRHYGKEPNNDHDRIGYHFTISWSPEEQVPPEMALEITRKFCESYLSDYEVVFSAHLDQAHMHTHFCFNSVSYKNGRKYRYEDQDWEKILQPLLDDLCSEQGLHTLDMDTGKTLEEYKTDRKGKRRKGKSASGRSHSNTSYRKKEEYSTSDHIRDDIDSLINICSDFEEFLAGMQEKGYQLKQGTSEKYGPYLAVWTKGMKIFRRTHTLGADYTVSMIKSRIAAFHKPLPDMPLDPQMQFLTGRRRFRCRIHYQSQNLYLRKQYARLYRLGVIPKQQSRLPYKERRDYLKKLRRVEYELQIIDNNHLQSLDDVEILLRSQEELVTELQKELKEFRIMKKPYDKMQSVYKKLDELEGACILFQDGDDRYRSESEAYLKLSVEAGTFGHTREELETWMCQAQERKRQLRKKYREEKEKLEAVKELRQEYAETEKMYEPASDEILADMDSDDTARKRIRKRIL